MRKFYSLLVLFFIFSSSYAAHTIGYDMSLINIKDTANNGTNFYKIRVKFYRDANGPSISPAFKFKVYKNSTNAIVPIPGLPNGEISAVKINPTTMLQYERNDCPPNGYSGQKVEYGLYESLPVDLSILNDSNGYYLSCISYPRNYGAINTLGGPAQANSYGMILSLDLPRLSSTSIYKHNSSPEFTKTPLTYFCVGKFYTFNWEVVDPDEDSLVYSMAQPTDDGPGKPFRYIPYAPGYGLFNMADGAPDIAIDSMTGRITYRPTVEGIYLVSFKCEEYRNGIKIGEIRREVQIETVLCNEAPPVVKDEENRRNYIIDTVHLGELDYQLLFTGNDHPNDTLTMEYQQSYGDNLLMKGAKFGELGSSGSITKIQDKGSVQGEFRWIPDCDDIRQAPYRFDVIVYDRTCPAPLYDTVRVILYVRPAFTNYPPVFVSPDTFVNQHTLTYYIDHDELFRLDSITGLKVIDTNVNQLVSIDDIPDVHDPSDFRNRYIFKSNPGSSVATATFTWKPRCIDVRDEPYKVKFIAFDDDCPGLADTSILNLEIYVVPGLNKLPDVYITSTDPLIPVVNNSPFRTIDSMNLRVGHVLYMGIKLVDTANLDSNKYRNTWIDSWNLQSFAVPGGTLPNFEPRSGVDSASTYFSWSPNAANLRDETYNLDLFIGDGSCSKSIHKTIRIKVNKSLALGVATDLSSMISIYPNPVSDKLYIGHQANIRVEQLRLFTIEGKELFNTKNISSKIIDVSSLPEGLYLLRLQTSEGMVQKKINIVH
jgi:hypothetical protein